VSAGDHPLSLLAGRLVAEVDQILDLGAERGQVTNERICG
jgi:hypothetical protein